MITRLPCSPLPGRPKDDVGELMTLTKQKAGAEADVSPGSSSDFLNHDKGLVHIEVDEECPLLADDSCSDDDFDKN